jgi:hypothetical protein
MSSLSERLIFQGYGVDYETPVPQENQRPKRDVARPFGYNSGSGSGAEPNRVSSDARISATTRDVGVVVVGSSDR